MKLNQIPKMELELLPYTAIAKMYLEENKTTKNTADLFREVCNLLQLSEDEYVDNIADFFESLTTSKEFILLDDGKWDLKSNHKVKVIIDDIEDETLITNTTIKSRDDFKESTHAAVENITNTVSNTISNTTTTMENIAENYTNTASINSNDPEYINDQGVKNLDSTYFVTDPANYNPDDTGKQKISSNDRVKQIAQIGFDESAKRIAGEGTENKESEIVSTETVSPNNYFTRLYSESDRVYTNIKRECFVVTRKNDLGCGVSIYIDSVTGLIIGGRAFGD